MKVGDTVYKIIGGATVAQCSVMKVGRKYFYLGGNKYRLDDMMQVTPSGDQEQLYVSEQEAQDLVDTYIMSGRLRTVLGYYGAPNCSIDQLRRMCTILDEE